MEHFAWTVALTRMISAVFRRGGDVSFIVEELKVSTLSMPVIKNIAVLLPLSGSQKSAGSAVQQGILSAYKNDTVKITNDIRWPHSLGLFYSAFTYFLGFKVNEGEYKLMGLSSYGKPKFYDLIHELL